MAVGEPVDQALGFVPGKQVVGVLLDEFSQMRSEHGGMVDHRVTSGDGLRLQFRRNPFGGRIECRLARVLSRHIRRRGAGTDSKQTVPSQLPPCNLCSAQIDDILSLAQRQIVGDMDRRNQEA